jgi:acetyl esterase/lipase
MKHMPYPLQTWLTDFNTMMGGLYQEGYSLSPEAARVGLANLTRSFVSPGPKLPLVMDAVLETEAAAIPTRIYHPKESEILPVLVYLHGGGHMAGSIDVYDPICRRLAQASSHTVISVGYRLAPEHGYPSGIDDAEQVLLRYPELLLEAGLGKEAPLSLGGDSAGGAMAATLAQRYQTGNSCKIENLILIYPSLDYTLSSNSVAKFAQGFLLEQDKIEWYFQNYFQKGEDYRKASPLHMELDTGFARTLIVTAGFCPLSDEGHLFATRLQESGVEILHKHFPTMVHAFLNLEQLVEAECRETYEVIGKFLNR